MGTFADMYRGKDAYIPEEKKAEFIERVEKVFQAGGMMERDCIQMYGKKLPILRKAKMKEGGMNFYYNYFEDTCWKKFILKAWRG